MTARVVFDLPVEQVFSYRVPAALAGRIGPGQRVRAPFRGRPRLGVVVGLEAEDDPALAPLAEARDPLPALTPSLLELARGIARETCAAWGEVVLRGLPPETRGAPPEGLPATWPPAGVGRSRLVIGGGRDRVIEESLAEAIGAGRGVLLLAPEIELAEGWARRIECRHGIQPVRLHSGLPTAKRWEGWWALRQGRSRVVVGTRSACLAPIPALGLTVVVDEHDLAHKAVQTPRLHAREVALARAAQEGGDLLLASAAPSLEAWCRVRAGRAELEEAKGGDWPVIERVDLRETPRERCLAPALRAAIARTLGAGRQVLLLLNRLGFGAALRCPECGAVRRCPDCRIALTYHLEGRRLHCHLCGFAEPARSLCPRCRGRRMEGVGWGTERVEAEAREAFPEVGVARLDGESARGRRGEAIRRAFRAGAIHLLVGTQMAARLLPHPGVGLLGVISADATLDFPDFRAGERTFQLLWGLAELLPPEASLFIQSYYPEHYALEAVAQADAEVFYRAELASRQELTLPPLSRLARILIRGPAGASLAASLGERLRAGSGLIVYGPTPLDARRWQLLVKGGATLPEVLGECLLPLRGRKRVAGGRWELDVDPVELR